MDEKEFITLNKEILIEFLEDVPEDYEITVEITPNLTIPVMNFDIDDDLREVILKPGDLNENKI